MTRSLSNVIKSYSVRYDDVVMKTIDSQLNFNTVAPPKASVIPQVDQQQGEFVEGLSALVVDAFSPVEDNTEKASEIIENATKEATEILEHARLEGEKIKSDAFSSGKTLGYEEGALKAKQENQRMQYEYEMKANLLQKQYEDRMHELEPEMVKILASLVQKITGIVVEDKEEVILYLIRNAIKNMDRSNEYTLRVSKDDYEYVSTRKDILIEAVGREVALYITEDINLQANQCMIETELQVINCSLDIQLNNLITDLKLIGGI